MAKQGKYPAKDGWIHVTLRFDHIPTEEVVKKMITQDCVDDYKWAEYRAFTKTVRLVYRKKPELLISTT